MGAFWSRPADNKTPHLHVDDWNQPSGEGEFGYPIGYSSHEDASFLYQTTSDKIAGGKVGSAYGQAVRVVRVAPSSTPSASITGDPHFYGAHGDRLDFKGRNHTTYALLSARYLQANALFEHDVFVMGGECTYCKQKKV